MKCSLGYTFCTIRNSL